MGTDRRNFLKTLGVAGFSLTAGKSFASLSKKSTPNDSYAILFDSTLCIGCQACEYACSDEYGLPYAEDMPVAGEHRILDETRRVVINCYETSKGEMYVRNSCNHCIQPACASACLTKAMLKTDEGPVIWRDDKCMGCRYCMVSCPYDIPKFEYNSPNPKIQKCRMCYERIEQGKIPACVEECTEGAIVFGKRSELLEIAKERIYAEPDKYNHHIYGETEAGGTNLLYLASVPFEELGLNTKIQPSSYPELTKGFLYSVPTIFVLWPALLLGLRQATKNNQPKEIENE
jgi:Fe-S-cluster-containing dehydrogenase component